MPYQRMKSENFHNFGGINQKISQADLSALEFLDLSNFDFIVTGGLQQRPGSQTFLIGNNSSQTSTISYFLTGTSIFATFSVTSGSTFYGQAASSIYEFSNLSGISYILFNSPGGFAYSSTFAIGSMTLAQMYVTTNDGSSGTISPLFDPATQVVSSGDTPKNPNFSFAPFVNRIFFCNGDHFYKWDGATSIQWRAIFSGSSFIENTFVVGQNAYKYCLPPGISCFASIVGTTTGTGSFSSATYTYSYGLINDRGFYGPPSPPVTISGVTVGTGNQIAIFGFSYAVSSFNMPGASLAGFTIPMGFGVGCSQISSYTGVSLVAGSSYYSQVAIYRDNGPGTGRFLVGYVQPNYPLPYASSFVDNGVATKNIAEPTCIYATLAPQFIDVYNNQLFMAGFSQAPSTVQFSDIGEPESVQASSNFDVRTNDGDVITGIKAAFSNLFVFKRNSITSLNGTDPTNFTVNTISDQYGCVSNKAITNYESQLLFLDKKGIAMFNGVQAEIISQKLDPIFDKMNITAAYNTAWMIHNKERNQIWCGIPSNGSTLINQIIVYDYLVNAWTHFDGPPANAACAIMGFGNEAHRTVYFGGYTGFLGKFGASLTSDFGNSITVMAQTRFMSEMGQSVEKMWRRLYINQKSAIGSSIQWNIGLCTSYSLGFASTFSITGVSYQVRADFGVSSKVLSVNFRASTSTDVLSLTGFTVESRFQRNQ